MSVVGVVDDHWRLFCSSVLSHARTAPVVHAGALLWLSLSPGLGFLMLCLGSAGRARGWRATGLWLNLALNHLALGTLYWVLVGLKMHGALMELAGFAGALVILEAIPLNGLIGVHYHRRAGRRDAGAVDEWAAEMDPTQGQRRVRFWIRCVSLLCLVAPALPYLAIRARREWRAGREGADGLYPMPGEGRSDVVA